MTRNEMINKIIFHLNGNFEEDYNPYENSEGEAIINIIETYMVPKPRKVIVGKKNGINIEQLSYTWEPEKENVSSTGDSPICNPNWEGLNG